MLHRSARGHPLPPHPPQARPSLDFAPLLRPCRRSHGEHQNILSIELSNVSGGASSASGGASLASRGGGSSVSGGSSWARGGGEGTPPPPPPGSHLRVTRVSCVGGGDCWIVKPLPGALWPPTLAPGEKAVLHLTLARTGSENEKGRSKSIKPSAVVCSGGAPAGSRSAPTDRFSPFFERISPSVPHPHITKKHHF